MNKLWIFGDSFSTGRDANRHISWTNLLAEKLGAELKITAKGGTSIGWLMYESFLAKDEFKEDDYIIFQTSTLNRAFLDKTKPSMTEFWKDCPHWNALNKKEKEGYTFHLERIHDEEILQQHIQMWLRAMDYYTSHLKNKPILSRGWDIGKLDMPMGWILCEGFLIDMSLDEFSGSRQEGIDWMLDNGGDPRHNHFSKTNHYILADLFYQGFVKKEPPDFNNLKTQLYKTYPKVGKETWETDWII